MDTQITKGKAKTLRDFAAAQREQYLPRLEPNRQVLAALEDLGRIRLSRHYFMRDFLYSEVAAAHGFANVPDDAELAIKAGRGLCENLLEPLRSVFGHVTIRSRVPERQRQRLRGQAREDGLRPQRGELRPPHLGSP